MAEIPHLNPTQQRIYDLLLDRQSHHSKEILALMERGVSISTMRVHITHLREKLKGTGETIICEITSRGRGHGVNYRMVYLEPSARS